MKTPTPLALAMILISRLVWRGVAQEKVSPLPSLIVKTGGQIYPSKFPI